MISAQEALQRLKKGNQDFVASMRKGAPPLSDSRRTELPQVQDPFAVILGCSDARVPAEIIFNQGINDLFIVRVAGNIVAPSAAGSVEYAAALLNARLVVVLGHSHCGAVGATVDELQNHTQSPSPNLGSIIDCVRPSVEPLMKTDLRNDRDKLVDHAVRANVSASANYLRHGSALMERAIQKDGMVVVGAEYYLETGVVDFFDGLDTFPVKAA